MTKGMTCLACMSYTFAIREAYMSGKPCPHCGTNLEIPVSLLFDEEDLDKLYQSMDAISSGLRPLDRVEFAGFLANLSSLMVSAQMKKGQTLIRLWLKANGY